MPKMIEQEQEIAEYRAIIDELKGVVEEKEDEIRNL